MPRQEPKRHEKNEAKDIAWIFIYSPELIIVLCLRNLFDSEVRIYSVFLLLRTRTTDADKVFMSKTRDDNDEA